MERVGGGLSGTYRAPKTDSTVWKPANTTGSGSSYGAPLYAAALKASNPPTYSGPGSPGASSNYFGDPAYEMAKAFATRTREEAQARAQQKKTAAAIQFGDASGVAGLGADVAKQAADNPFSVLKNLQYGYDRGVTDLEDQLNKANLFYGGYRGDQLANAGHQFQQANYGARTQFQGLLSDVGDQLSAALMQADMAEQQAALNAQLMAFAGQQGGGSDGGGGQQPTQTYSPVMPFNPWQQNPNTVYRPAGLGVAGGYF